MTGDEREIIDCVKVTQYSDIIYHQNAFKI